MVVVDGLDATGRVIIRDPASAPHAISDDLERLRRRMAGANNLPTMRISITRITQLSDREFRVLMLINGGSLIKTEIHEGTDPLRSMFFTNVIFKDILDRAGQLTHFAKCYWNFRDGKTPPLPWDYEI